MGLLHQPELEPGPHRDLVVALHRLHHEAGRPSLRAIARRAGCSHTAVFHVLTHPRVPAWSLLEVVVGALDGDPADFRDLWLAATADGARHLPPPARAIAGRRAELLVVRRHLETGGGLLLVTGEPGIGKTTLVGAAAQQVSTFVASASGLPQLSEVPFALLSDALRRAWLVDDGRWVAEALATCPAFVPPALARILPELEVPVDDVDDRFAPARLHAAIESALAALSAIRPLALVLDDVHWSDPSSRALIERHVVSGRGVPVVASLRTDESADTDAWLARVRRKAVLVLNLAPLTQKETREHLRLLVGPRLRRGDVERIHRLGQGMPLFTEELARSMGVDAVPEELAGLLARQLDGLGPSARSVLLVAALADRPLPPELVAEATSMDRPELTDALRELVSRHLLADPYSAADVIVRHPLLAASVRSRLVPGEAAPVHRRIASALAATERPTAAEVAEHWRGAGEPREELRWRVAAGRAACERLARDEEAGHWERALELWPADGPAPAEVDIARSGLLLELVHAMVGSGRTVEAGRWVEEALALAPTLPDPDHALALQRASEALADLDPAASLRLADGAIAVFETLGDRTSLVRAMGGKSCALRGAGRNDEADRVVDDALGISARLDEPALHRNALIERAWHHVAAGRTTAGLRLAREARWIVVEDDPFSDVWLGCYHSDLLLVLGASGDEVADAVDAGLIAARDAGIGSFVLSTLLVCNAAEARIHEGAVGAASRLVRPHTKDEPRWATRFLHLTRAWVEVLRGDLERAERRIEAVAADDFEVSAQLQTLLLVQTLCDLWRDLPGRAIDRLWAATNGVTATSWSPYTGTLLALGARAAADIAALDPSRRPALAARLDAWHRQWTPDPLAPEAVHAAAAATRSTWLAELARLRGTAQLQHWGGAAEQWDLVGRPHEAAYCRWRAAELAVREQRGTLAARLLRRAHAQARGHVPLIAAIDECRSRVSAGVGRPGQDLRGAATCW